MTIDSEVSENRAASRDARHYLVLDAARGIAALAVMIFHMQKYIYPNVVITAVPSLFQRSYLAVDLFFLMSGLVIARAYEQKLLDGRMTFLGFFRTRLLRLYPLYIFGTILGFIYAVLKFRLVPSEPFEIWPNVAALVANAFFFPSLSDRLSDIFPFDPAAWSLALEWAINLIYAIWAVRQSTRVLFIIALASAVALIPCAISYGAVDMGWGASTALGGALRICFSFTLGIVIYRCLASRRLSVPAINPLVLLAVLSIALLTPIGNPNVYYDLLCALVIFPLFVVFACCSHAAPAFSGLFTDLGRLSYAIYILHNPLMLGFGGVWKLVTHEELEARSALSGPLLIAFVLIGSYLATALFDERLRRYWSRRAPKAALKLV